MNVYFIIMAHLIYLNNSGISGINIEIKILLGIDAFPARPQNEEEDCECETETHHYQWDCKYVQGKWFHNGYIMGP